MRIGVATRLAFVPALMLVGLATLGASVALAGGVRPGAPDRSFGQRGSVVRGFGTEPGSGGASEAAPLLDGGFLVRVGGSIGRYLPDGAIDSAFGEDGYLIRVGAEAIASGEDGRIYAIESPDEEEQVLVRLLGDGSPDLGFGTGGTVALGSKTPYSTVLAVPGGESILAGVVNEKERTTAVVATELRPDGSPDPGFGIGGTSVVRFEPIESDHEFRFAMDAGRLLFAAETNAGKPPLVIRLTAAGKLDTGFSGAYGVSPQSFESPVEGLAVRGDGGIVIAGSQGRVLGLLPDGGPDPGFGENGAEKLAALKSVGEPLLATLSDGGVAIGGTSRPEGARAPGDFAAALLAADGSLDPSFGTGGIATIDAGGDEAVTSLIAPPGGGLLLAGSSGSGNSKLIAAVRYTATGGPDPAFGTGGILLVRPVEHAEDEVTALAAGPRGPIFAVGRAAGRVLIAGYSRDGRPDPAFGEEGVVLGEREGEEALSVARYPGGRLLIGTGAPGGGELIMLDSRGRRDPGFGADGAIRPVGLDRITDLAILRSGEILAAGSGGSPCRDVVERFRPDGVADDGFGTGGVAAVARGCHAVELAPRPDGSFVAAVRASRIVLSFSDDGAERTPLAESGAERRELPERLGAIAVDSGGGLLVGGEQHHRLALVRLGRRGRIDRSFGRHGEAIREVGRDSSVTGIAIDRRGRIVVTARASTCEEFGCEGPTAAVVRFGPLGHLDRSFGRAGVWTGPRELSGLPAIALLGGGSPLLGGWIRDGGDLNRDLMLERLRG